ncbi:13913_t:CDS:2, partial [Dentiscutata erythropus]
ARCIKVKMWDDSPFLLRQLNGIGEQYTKKLAEIGIKTFEQLIKCEAWKIETACNRHPPFGHNVRDTVMTLPMIKLDINHGFSKSKEYDLYVVNINLTNKNNKKVITKRYGINLNVTFIAVTEDNNVLLDFRQAA